MPVQRRVRLFFSTLLCFFMYFPVYTISYGSYRGIRNYCSSEIFFRESLASLRSHTHIRFLCFRGFLVIPVIPVIPVFVYTLVTAILKSDQLTLKADIFRSQQIHACTCSYTWVTCTGLHYHVICNLLCSYLLFYSTSNALGIALSLTLIWSGGGVILPPDQSFSCRSVTAQSFRKRHGDFVCIWVAFKMVQSVYSYHHPGLHYGGQNLKQTWNFTDFSSTGCNSS